MPEMKSFAINNRLKPMIIVISLIALTSFAVNVEGQKNTGNPSLKYTISMPEPASHLLLVVLECSGLNTDTIELKMPKWMPGYYQNMNYSRNVRNFTATNLKNKTLPVIQSNENTWHVIAGRNTPFRVSYEVFSDRRFVANNYLDTTRAYIVTAATLMYLNGNINTPVNIKIIPYGSWKNIATGLKPNAGKNNEFSAPDFDVLYDCPILIGNLEELPSFDINGIKHRFIAFNPGTFDKELFISKLGKAVKASTELMGHIPYDQYTFIGIGPGNGGIEHLNNTTVSFNGNGLNAGSMLGTLKFLTHEYFHHYNVKRIRPFELGPFNYDSENKTNLLWVSEGLTVYYEYVILRRAELMNDEELFKSIVGNINAFENDPGREFQSLAQASYDTWSAGPFGGGSGGPDRYISYYDKGPVVGFILDLAIRNASGNKKSLDDVMRYLYNHYYLTLNRGFTDAEFQMACEMAAGTSLSSEFEYVYTTKKIDYAKYLSCAGLKITEETDQNTLKRKFTITVQENLTPLQSEIFRSWTGK